ncbi:MAG: DUF4255 domain-containing protein [bacterium]|nr:DUF4255 domain-containing protein [bacterium]
MALLNLSLVTKTLINLLREYLIASPVGTWTELSPPPITQRPPDKVTEEDVLCLYLYHISEDTRYKNLPAPGNDAPPIRYVPMGLNLYYQLSAHSPYGETDDLDQPQLMMGIALKAFHDYPFIDDSTQVNLQDILEGDLREAGNKLRIVLQPIAHNEAVSYWNNGSSSPRLSAYYQVSIVLLEPEETASRAGRVLEYGVHTFIQGAPRLDFSQNVLKFTIPGEPVPREIKLRPAQVPVGDRVSFSGTGFTGDSVSLLLKNNRWDDPVSGLTFNPLELDPAWAVAVSGDKVEAVVQEKVILDNPPEIAILPGIYSALVKVIRRSTLRDGSTRDFEHLSNECPFTVTPRIDDINPLVVDVTDVVTVDGYIFEHGDLPDSTSTVQVYLGENRLTLKTTGTLNAGEFKIVNPLQLQFMLRADSAPGLYPVRIFVNGAESPPKWIEVS